MIGLSRNADTSAARSASDRRPGETPNAKTAKVRSTLVELASAEDAVLEWKSDLEACLKLPSGKATPEWQEQNLGKRSLREIERDLPNYFALGQSVRSWLG